MHALVKLTTSAGPLRLRRLERRYPGQPWQLLAQGLARHYGGYIWPTVRGYRVASGYPL